MHDLNAIAVFVEVARSGNFSAAAQKLNIPLSTVSRKVSELEKSLGLQLLERSTRNQRMTELGEAFFEQCQPGVRTFNAAVKMLETQQTEIAGTLRISVPPGIAEHLFLPIINIFQEQHPKAKISVFISERMIDRIDNDVDFSFRVGPQTDSSLISKTLLSYRHVLVASPTYISQHTPPLDVSELSQHRLIAFGFWNKPEKTWTLSHRKKPFGITFRPDLSFNDYTPILHATLQHQGIAEIPSILCSKAIKDKKLVRILPQHSFQKISLQAVYSSRTMAQLPRLFLDCCTDYLSSFS